MIAFQEETPYLPFFLQSTVLFDRTVQPRGKVWGRDRAEAATANTACEFADVPGHPSPFPGLPQHDPVPQTAIMVLAWGLASKRCARATLRSSPRCMLRSVAMAARRINQGINCTLPCHGRRNNRTVSMRAPCMQNDCSAGNTWSCKLHDEPFSLAKRYHRGWVYDQHRYGAQDCPRRMPPDATPAAVHQPHFLCFVQSLQGLGARVRFWKVASARRRRLASTTTGGCRLYTCFFMPGPPQRSSS